MIQPVAGAIVALLIALAAVFGISFGGSSIDGLSSSSRGAESSAGDGKEANLYDNLSQPLPASARQATANEVDSILRSSWTTDPRFEKTQIGFEQVERGYMLTGGPCNGFGVLIQPIANTSNFIIEPMAVPLRYCGEASDYESAVAQVFFQATSFYVDGSNDSIAYVVGPKGSLKLNKVK